MLCGAGIVVGVPLVIALAVPVAVIGGTACKKKKSCFVTFQQ
jgi:hypothetical protein